MQGVMSAISLHLLKQLYHKEMGRYTIDEYKKRLTSLLDKEKIVKNFHLAVEDTRNEMQERIFTRGENEDGFVFDYAEKTKKIRQKKGRQTQFVDFKFTNDLYKDFISSQALDKKKLIVTFQVKRNLSKEKVTNLNDMFGTVFKANNEEENFFQERFKRLIKINIFK